MYLQPTSPFFHADVLEQRPGQVFKSAPAKHGLRTPEAVPHAANPFADHIMQGPNRSNLSLHQRLRWSSRIACGTLYIALPNERRKRPSLSTAMT
jgi:hypothetical protein